MILRAFYVTLCAFTLICLSSIAQAGVMNGEFEDGTGDTFDFWSTDPFFNAPTALNDGNRYVKFGDADFGSQLAQEIMIPVNAEFLSLDFQLMTDGPTGVFGLPDGFQATLFDINNPVTVPGFGTIFPGVLSAGSDPLFQPAFFAIDDRMDTLPMLPDTRGLVSESTTAAGLRAGWSRITLDVSSLAPQTLLLDFTLGNGFDIPDVQTMVFLDNVVVSAQSAPVVPEPTSLAIFAVLAPLALALRKHKSKRLKQGLLGNSKTTSERHLAAG